jgi:chromate transporter
LGTGAAGTSAAIGVLPVFLYFLKVGAVLVGSGYVLLAVLRADLVVKMHWLSDAQLLDAIAVSQATPGPFLQWRPSSGICWADGEVRYWQP